VGKKKARRENKKVDLSSSRFDDYTGGGGQKEQHPGRVEDESFMQKKNNSCQRKRGWGKERSKKPKKQTE